jgi:2,4-dienoyl-CoA reductase-like NADH-dependent reductase (Old Yellow Enzyme family)
MSVDTAPLFEPLTVRGKTLRNRIVMPPMVVLRGLTKPQGIEWYRRHAEGGVGLVIVESTPVTRFGQDLTADDLRPLVQAVHDAGALAAIQLFPHAYDHRAAPADLSQDDIDALLEAYRAAAAICAEAGFDGVEPHGAHGFLLNQFFSPAQNRRSDDYGGDLEGRMRMALDICAITRQGLGKEPLLFYRHTPVAEGFYGIHDSLTLAAELVKLGVDILDISPAGDDAPGDLAEPFTRCGVPVIAVGRLDRVERALEVLNQRRAHLVAVARGLIADPDWPRKVREGRFADIVQCTYCDEKCFGNLRAGLPVDCTQWA